MINRSDVTKWIVRGIIGLGFGYIATSVLGLNPMITVNFGRPAEPPGHSGKPYGSDARRGPDRGGNPGHGYDGERRRSDNSRMGDILREEARSPGRR